MDSERGLELSGLLPTYLKDQLTAVLVRPNDTKRDVFCWGPTAIDQFSVRSAYTLAAQSLNQHPKGIWKQIWCLKVPQRIRMFIWLVHHGKLMTNYEPGSKNWPTLVRLDRFVIDSRLIESILLPSTRRRVDRLKLDKTQWTRPNSRDDSINSMKIG